MSIASELATNAVVHDGTPYVVELSLGDPVRIEVTDSGRRDEYKVVWAEVPLNA